MNTFGSQIIDLLYFLSDGRKALRVHGVTKTFTSNTDSINGFRRITADDFVVFQMELEGGIFAHVTINSQSSGFRQEVTLNGSNGKLTARNERLFYCRNGSNEEEVILKGESLKIKTGENPIQSGLYLEGTLNLFRHLASKFSTETELMSGLTAFNDAQYNQAVIEAVQRSSLERSWIKVIEQKAEEDLLSILDNNSA